MYDKNKTLIANKLKFVFSLFVLLNIIFTAIAKPLEFDLIEKDAISKNQLKAGIITKTKDYFITKFSYDNGFFKDSVMANKLNITNGVHETENHYLLHGASLIDLIGLKEGLYTIKIALGNPKQEFEVIVDSGSFLLWIPSEECRCYYSNNKFKFKSSETFSKTDKSYKLNYISGKVSGSVSKDGISLSDGLLIPNFSFLLSDVVDAPVKVDGILGFARKYSNYPEEFSIMEQLKKNKIIEKKIFSQKITGGNLSNKKDIENEEKDLSKYILKREISDVDENLGERVISKNSKFFIGDFPEEIKSNMHNYSTCKAVEEHRSVAMFWTCNLTAVIFKRNLKALRNLKNKINANEKLNESEANDLEFEEKIFNRKLFLNADIENPLERPIPAIFDTGSNVILAPPHYSQIFKNVYFAKAIKNGKCFSMQDYSGSYGFRCNEDIDFETDLPNVLFKFDNEKIYELSNKFLFNYENKKFNFKIVFAHVPGNGWLLGQPFLKSYHMVFDYEQDNIGFYTDNKDNEHEGFFVQNDKKEIDLVMQLKDFTHKLNETNSNVEYEYEGKVYDVNSIRRSNLIYEKLESGNTYDDIEDSFNESKRGKIDEGFNGFNILIGVGSSVAFCVLVIFIMRKLVKKCTEASTDKKDFNDFSVMNNESFYKKINDAF